MHGSAFLVHAVVVKIKSLFHLGQLWKVESSLDVIHLKIYPPFCIILQHQLHVCKHKIARSAKSKHVIVIQLADRIQIVFGDEGSRTQKSLLLLFAQISIKARIHFELLLILHYKII